MICGTISSRARMGLFFVGSLAAALLVAAAPTSAHEAPLPVEPATRLLHDHNDDCGGDGVAVNCQGTHDLIALDVREAWDQELGNILVFRFYLDEGDGGDLRDELTFTIEGERHTFTLEQAGARFAGDFDRVGSKTPLNDGTRFTVDATVAYDRLGIQVGDRLDDYAVTAYRDNTQGDFMPGGYHGPAGTVSDPPQGQRPTNFELASYRLVGPTKYAALAMRPEEARLDLDKELLVTLTVTNRLSASPQSFQFTLEAGDGVRARFHDPSAGSGGYSDTYTLDLRQGAEGSLHLALEGEEAGASGTVTVTMTSDRGARMQQVLAYGIGTAPPDPTDTESTGGADNEAPGVALVWPVALISLAVLVRRR